MWWLRLGIAIERKVDLSLVFAGQNVGVKQIDERIWLVSFMRYDLGFFDDETCRLESADNRFQAKVLPMSPAMNRCPCERNRPDVLVAKGGIEPPTQGFSVR